MQTTPQKLISSLTESISKGNTREDEPMFVLMLSREDITQVAEWHPELSEFSEKEISNLSDKDLEKVFGSLVEQCGDMDAVYDALGNAAAEQCATHRKKSERLKMYLELQKEFGGMGQ
jgi:hypothetical protein